SSRTRREEQL
nr:Chain C, Protein E6 [Human papillomavirus 16]